MAAAATTAAINASVTAHLTKTASCGVLKGAGNRLMNQPSVTAQLDDYLAATAGLTGLATRIARACVAAQPDGAMDAARDAAITAIARCHEQVGNGRFTEGGDYVPVYQQAFDETGDTILERDTAERIKWEYFAPGAGEPDWWRELGRAARGDSVTRYFAHFTLWSPHILVQLPRIIGSIATSAARPIASHTLPFGTFGEALNAYLSDRIPETIGAQVRASMNDVFRIEAYAVLKEAEGGLGLLDPQQTAALAQEVADLPRHLASITGNLSLGTPSPRAAAEVLLNNNEFRALMRTQQVEAVGIDVEDAPYRYMQQLDRAFDAHVQAGGRQREALIPGCELVETDGRKHLRLRSDDPGAPNDGAWQALTLMEGAMGRAGWYRLANFQASMDRLAEACMVANKSVSSENKDLFTDDFVGELVRLSVAAQAAQAHPQPITSYLTRVLNAAAQAGDVRALSAEAAPEDEGEVDVRAPTLTDADQREEVRQGATGREWLEQLQASLSPLEQEAQRAARESLDDIVDAGKDLRQRQAALEAQSKVAPLTRAESSELRKLKTQTIPRNVDEIARRRQALNLTGPTDLQITTARDEAKQQETVDGIVTSLRTKQLAGEPLTEQEVRIIDAAAKLRELFGTGRIKTAAGQSALAVLDAAISDHGRRHKSYKLSDKEVRSRNSKVGLNWHSRVADARKAKAVYLSGQAQANRKLFGLK
jgi:hypothetical protein